MDHLPPGTWVNYRGVRHFMPADKPVDILQLFPRMYEPPKPPVAPMIPVPAWRAHRHICKCGCLLFGVENCPNCRWLSQAKERTA